MEKGKTNPTTKMKPTNKTYRKFQELILKSEGKALEDELGFGDYFRWNGDLWFVNCVKCIEGRIFAFSCSGYAHSWPEGMTENESIAMRYQVFYQEDIKDFEILGQDITLERVLLSLDKNSAYFLNGRGSYEEFFLQITNFKKELSAAIYWQLNKPAHEQSEETLLKLIELLK